MLKRHKDLLRAIVAPLRTTLAGTALPDASWQRGDLDRELERLGIAPDGTLTPLDALPNASEAERRARYAAEVAIAAAVNGAKGAEAERRRNDARDEVIERAAYTWINRLLALRAMEARGLIDETLRNNPDYDGVSEALYILRSDAPARTAGDDGGWLAVIEDACAAQVAALPGLFDLNDPASALRPSTGALLRCLALVGGAPSGYTLAEADAAFADPDAIGWAYQFYQEAPKTRIDAKTNAGGKVETRSELAAKTQLFTEPYMVQWLLQNSLGRSYHEAYPDSALPATWEYYIRQRPEGQQAPESPRPLHALDLIDPCCGSGHFLREAFDMFAAMYRERHPDLSPSEIADRILTRHLHGIDLDPRAAQLAALTLYLRAWEYVRDEGRKTKDGRRALGASSTVYRPSILNIATTPSGLSAGALPRHLRRHPEDRVMKPLLEGVFAALEQADILGSLLRPSEHIDTAIKALQQPHTMQMDFDADDAALRRTITALANSDPAELKRMLLDRVAQSFHAEAGADDDVAAQLFGREAEGGVRLLQLLDRKYAVVVTNPPYMGSKNMDAPLRKYVEQHYKAGKRDLYAAFILRCLELCRVRGRVVMVTQQSWMFNSSYTDLRGTSEESGSTNGTARFGGLLSDTSIEYVAHLGRYAFSEIGNAAVAPVMFVLQFTKPSETHSIRACRLVAPRPSEVQSALLLRVSRLNSNYLSQSSNKAISNENLKGLFYETPQKPLLGIPNYPIVYWISNEILLLLNQENRLNRYASVRGGMSTGSNKRHTRYIWEILFNTVADTWVLYAKSDGYRKWHGLEYTMLKWRFDGVDIRQETGSVVPSQELYFTRGISYGLLSGGSLGARITNNSIFDNGCIYTYPFNINRETLIGLMNSRIFSYLLRVITQSIRFNAGYTELLPLPDFNGHNSLWGVIDRICTICIHLKKASSSSSVNEIEFLPSKNTASLSLIMSSYLHTFEAFNELIVDQYYKISEAELAAIFAETGIPAGFHPLIAGYDALPKLPADLDLPSLPLEVIDYLAVHKLIVPPQAELQRIKARLRALYEAGPGVKEAEEVAEATEEGDDEGEAAVSGAHIPIPTETFLEELSVKMQIHPISVYWLLEELRGEGARCKPEELRLLEDRLSVIVLRLLGHRWPKQIEAGEPVPSWADEDGIIPISGGTGEPTLAERVRARLRAEDGDLHAQRTEALLQELTGQSLEDWLRREFFKRHIRQFKYRPIAWQLASDPSAAAPDAKAKKRLGGRRQPAFECMVYYHACGGDVLARIRTQYVEPLLRAARQQLEQASRVKDEDGVVQANMRIQELAEFNRRLQLVAERGFFSPELAAICEKEPIDRWSHDGFLPPASPEEFLRQEQSWRVDLNDGVRVNIAPVQLAGLLISDVLKAADAKKAIADRARWRSDERRWVRAGKLPRCGWLGDDVLESAEWTRLAPQREAERAKLEEKRREIKLSEHLE